MHDIGEFIGEVEESWAIEKGEGFSALELHSMVDDVGGGAGDVGDDGSKLSDEAVEEGGFSDVGCSDDSDVHGGSLKIKAQSLKLLPFGFQLFTFGSFYRDLVGKGNVKIFRRYSFKT